MTKLALLNMYKGEKNLGMESLRRMISKYEDRLTWREFDVRSKNEMPDTSYDIYISTGGPGSPLKGDGPWETSYSELLDKLWRLNSTSKNKKHVLFICHSFQLACLHFGIAKARARKSPSFGIYKVHKTDAGHEDEVIGKLSDPFFAVDSREYQLVQPSRQAIEALGAKVLCREKIRPHVNLERAIMGVRFSNEWLGIQFHPEANPAEMDAHFRKPEIAKRVEEMFGLKKYQRLIRDLERSDLVQTTFDRVIPSFIETALSKLTPMKAA